MFNSGCLLKSSLVLAALTISGSVLADNLVNETYVGHKIFSTDQFLTEKGKEAGIHEQFEVSYQMRIDRLGFGAGNLGLREQQECVSWINPPTNPDDGGVCGQYKTIGWYITATSENISLGDYALTVKNLGTGQVVAQKSGVLTANISAWELPMLTRPVLPRDFTLVATVQNPTSVNVPFGSFSAQGVNYPLRLDFGDIDPLGTLDVSIHDQQVADLNWTTAPTAIDPYIGMYLTVKGPFSSAVENVLVAQMLRQTYLDGKIPLTRE